MRLMWLINIIMPCVNTVKERRREKGIDYEFTVLATRNCHHDELWGGLWGCYNLLKWLFDARSCTQIVLLQCELVPWRVTVYRAARRSTFAILVTLTQLSLVISISVTWDILVRFIAIRLLIVQTDVQRKRSFLR